MSPPPTNTGELAFLSSMVKLPLPTTAANGSPLPANRAPEMAWATAAANGMSLPSIATFGMPLPTTAANRMSLPPIATHGVFLPTTAVNRMSVPSGAAHELFMPATSTNAMFYQKTATNEMSLPTTAANGSPLPTNRAHEMSFPTTAASRHFLPTAAAHDMSLPTTSTNAMFYQKTAPDEMSLPTTAASRMSLPTTSVNEMSLPTTSTNAMSLPTTTASETSSPTIASSETSSPPTVANEMLLPTTAASEKPPLSPSNHKFNWIIENKLKPQYPKLFRVKYCDKMLLATTRDHKLLLVEENSPMIIELEELRDKSIKDIGYGQNYFLVLTNHGEVYARGINTVGQLGLGDMTPRSKATRVDIEGVAQINCGVFAAAAITFSGVGYQWGGNNRPKTSPRKIELPGGVRFRQIDCGKNVTLAVGRDNRVYGWGRQVKNILGRESPMIAKLPLNEAVRSVVCGEPSCLILTFENKLYEFSEMNGGQAFVPIDTPATFSRLLVFEAREGQYAGISNGDMYLGSTNDDQWYVWGNTKEGKLNEPTATSLSYLDSVVKYSNIVITQMITTTSTDLALPSIASRISRLFYTGERSDIEFYFPSESKILKAHRFILELSCGFLRQYLAEHSKLDTITIEGFTCTQFYHYFQFLYTQKLGVKTLGEALYLLWLSVHFRNGHLIDECCEVIIDQCLSVENCVYIHVYFLETGLVGFAERVAMFMVKHFAQLSTHPSFHQMMPEHREAFLKFLQSIPEEIFAIST